MKRNVFVMLLWFTSSALATTPTQLRTPEAVAAQLGVATEQLLVMVPTVRSLVIADALRKAAVERGVEVYLIVSAESVEEGGSFVPSIAVLEKVYTRLALVDRSFIIGDSGVKAFLLEGDLLSQSSQAFEGQATYALHDDTTLARRGNLFRDVWLAAPAYRSLIERFPFESP